MNIFLDDYRFNVTKGLKEEEESCPFIPEDKNNKELVKEKNKPEIVKEESDFKSKYANKKKVVDKQPKDDELLQEPVEDNTILYDPTVDDDELELIKKRDEEQAEKKKGSCRSPQYDEIYGNNLVDNDYTEQTKKANNFINLLL